TLVYQVLRTLGYKTGMIGTVETRIGNEVRPSRLTTPDAVTLSGLLQEMASKDTAYAIMEVSSHAIEQERVKGISFDVAAFTNITQDHLDYHESMEAYIQAKKMLFDSLDASSIAIINRDDPASEHMIKDCPAEIWSFGFKYDRDFRIIDEGSDGMVLDLDGTIVSTPLTGTFNAYNVAQAYLICLALGCTKASVANALSEAKGARGRLERVLVDIAQQDDVVGPAAAPTVFIDYAHTPDALENVLKTLAGVKSNKEKLHVVFGCGGDRDRTKRPLMGKIAENYADLVTITSDNPRTEDPISIIRDIRKGIGKTEQVFIEPDRKKAIRSSILDSDIHSIVIIAGKGHETYQEVHGRRHKFDDKEIAEKALRQWVDRRSGRKTTRNLKKNPEAN
ncbi:UDP-N-acetylmuramoyl-L-alanyl-D-glutamate--2,6-diaminopimelate ligase, partial [Balneolaceae bacterium ANBcel3]|nr:UDP-N-acetylmuramoyl-L-alanyl-D-glutamate--2,6-diaminopimelate ligase [Balneolaceae bacterium ANBcel3]